MPVDVIKEVAAACTKKRLQWEPDVIKTVTDDARQFGVAAAVKRHNRTSNSTEIPYTTVDNWLKHYQQHGKYFIPKKRGRHAILSCEEQSEVMDAAKKMRAAPVCKAITAGTFAAIARGVVARTRPGVLERNNGPFKMTCEWAKKILKKESWRPLGSTSDRVVPDSQIADHARLFFADLTSSAIPPPEMVFNLDEFCCLLGPNRKWSWHPASQRRTVPIRQTKEAFTSCVVSNAAGDLVMLQLIWEGHTSHVHANVQQEHPLIVQDHQPRSHYQNADTFARLAEAIIRHIDLMRTECPEMHALLIVDAAPQHGATKTFGEHNVRVVQIPKGQTHVFQPADQFIIRGLKAKASVAWDRFVEDTFASNISDVAIADINIQSKPILRQRMYSFLASAVDDLGQQCVLKSWEATGIPRALWGDSPSIQPMIDAVEARLRDADEPCGQCECGTITPRICIRCEDYVCDCCYTDHKTAWCTDLP